MQDEWDTAADTDVGDSDRRATSYERMCVALYTYRYGAITFLDLLALFEENLGLRSPQTDDQATLDQPG